MDLKLTIEGGAFWYRPDRVLFEDLDFEVRSGQVVAVLGPNGAGKTTFLRCAMGLLPWRRGRCCLDGKALDRLPPRERWRSIAYVPQARALPFSFTVLDVVLMGRSAHVPPLAQPGPADLAAARRGLERLGISALEGRPFRELSGGEAQLVFIARALAAEPRLIVLDEPESHLDFRNQLVIVRALAALAAEEGIACVVNTHFPENALRLADRVLLLGRGGAGHRFGPADELLSEANMEAFFGVRVKRLGFSEGGRDFRAVYPIEPSRAREAVNA